jgi:Domain of unknown function (DUF3786)
MAEYVDASYWQVLKAADPAVLCRHGRCQYLPDSSDYTLSLWGVDYRIAVDRQEIINTTPGAHSHPYFNVFIIFYLLLEGDISVVGEWISEKDFPGGATFFRGPHLLPSMLITERYGNDLQGFSARCQELGGTPLSLADRAFSFRITAEVPVAVLYWSGDADFPAEAKILFDRSLINAMQLDVVYSLAVTICHRLAGR